MGALQKLQDFLSTDDWLDFTGGEVIGLAGCQGLLRGFKVGMSPFLAGFEVVAFGPFVPGVDEDDAIAVGVGEFALGDGGEPVLIEFGGGVLKDGGVAAFAAGGIVPGGGDAGESLVGC